jgi:hypothetical protein
VIVNQAEELYNSSISFTEFDELTIDESEKLFADLQNEGIIKKNCSFGDAVWYTTNQYSNIGLHFKFSEFEYKKYEEMLGFGLEDFVLYLKAISESIYYFAVWKDCAGYDPVISFRCPPYPFSIAGSRGV